MRRPKLDLGRAKDQLLFRLHFMVAGQNTVNTDIEFLARKLDIPIQMAKLAAEDLASEGFCLLKTEPDFVEHPISGNLVEIETQTLELTRYGIEEVESWDDEKYERVANNSKLSPSEKSTLYNENSDVEANDDVRSDSVPASDRIVSRSDNQETWSQAVASLDRVIAEFKGDHKFGNEFAREKNALIRTLEAGRELLNDEGIRVQIGVALILEPLKIVRTRVEGYLAGHPGVTDGLTVMMITEAINAISKLLFGT